MKSFILQNKFFLLLILIFIISECIVNPIGNFPLNDDWSYGQSVMYFQRTGVINPGNFPSMTLYSHILWGSLFTNLFGFSFTILRISTFVSACFGLAFLRKLVIQISGNKILGFASCLVLMFNPILFSLSNTFMTDVNFNTLAIICCYLLFNYLYTNHIGYYIFFLVCSVLITFVRQYGIIFPITFLLICPFLKEKRGLKLILATVSVAVTYGLLSIYELHLEKILPNGSAYKFSGQTHFFSRNFWKALEKTFAERYKNIIIHALVYPMPLAIIFLKSLLKQLNIKLTIFILLINMFVIWLLFDKYVSLGDSIFSNMTLGPESFYESFKGARHNKFQDFRFISFWGNLLSAFITLLVLLLGITRVLLLGKSKQILNPQPLFFISLFATYTLMTLITESNFDRYYIPLTTISLILFAYLTKFNSLKTWPAIIPLMLWAYVSIFGTKDYMVLNRQKWEAYWYLRRELKIPKEKINGGFEVNCWNEGEGMGWRDFLNIDNFDYLIQFNPEPNFKALKEFEFQHYFPYKKDKIYIFVREHEK